MVTSSQHSEPKSDIDIARVADKRSILDIGRERLGIAPENLVHFERLVGEADALFGARHFDHYDILLALTERMGGIGLEHQRSAENQYEPTALIDWDAMDWDRNVVSHELVHRWNVSRSEPISC